MVPNIPNYLILPKSTKQLRLSILPKDINTSAAERDLNSWSSDPESSTVPLDHTCSKAYSLWLWIKDLYVWTKGLCQVLHYGHSPYRSIKLNHLKNWSLTWDTTMKSTLTGGNWQKWKRVFLTCPCHKIYRDEAVGLKSVKNTWKITIFVKMWNLGQYRENLIFCQ